MDSSLYPMIIPVVSAAIGGSLVKLIDFKTSKVTKNMDDAVSIRKELRERVEGLEKKLDIVMSVVDDWRKRYWDLYQAHNSLVAEHAELKIDHTALKADYGVLKKLYSSKGLSDLVQALEAVRLINEYRSTEESNKLPPS